MAAVTICSDFGAQYEYGCANLCETLLLILLDIYPEVRLLDHMVILFLMFLGTTILFSTAAAPFYIIASGTQVFLTNTF